MAINLDMKKLGLVKVNILFFLLISLPANGQIIPDGTLPNNSNVKNQDNITSITGGTQAGTNLFHSFEQFSVPTGGTAYFNNTPEIQNIFSRVTGGSISNIDGLIRINGAANLFLLNPNGIIFGSNARLDIGGSFLGTTARSINFTDGLQFSASSAQTAPLLTVSVPIGLQFGSNPGGISVQGVGHTISNPAFLPVTDPNSLVNGLQVQPGKTLALVGGDIALEGGVLTAKGGQIELGSINNGLVAFSSSILGWNLSYENVESLRDIQLSKKALVNSSGLNSGEIQLSGRQVKLSDGSLVLIQNQGLQLSGNISVNASELLEVEGTSSNGTIASALLTEATRSGRAGDIIISAKNLDVLAGGQILSRTFNTASSGSLKVNASQAVQVIGFSPTYPNLFSNVVAATFGVGKAENVAISTKKLIVRNGGNISSSTLESGVSGDVDVNAIDYVEVSGTTPKFFTSAALGTSTLNSGNAGQLKINTSRLVVKDGGVVNSSTLASGNAGSTDINASNSVEVIGTSKESIGQTSLGSSTSTTTRLVQQILGLPQKTSGNSGSINIITGRLSVIDRGRVSVLNEGSGKGGTLRINAGSINLNNGGSITAAAASGEGGNIFLRSHELQLRGGSNITASAGNNGNGGNININTDLLTVLETSKITADAVQGRGGNIQINTQGFFRSPDSSITASSQLGVNGTVRINTLLTNPNNGLVELPSVPIDILGLVAQGCGDGSGAKGASFVITGRGGLPPQPGEPLRVDAVRVTGATAETENHLVATNFQTNLPESSPQLVEANSWMVNSKGNVVLLAQPSQPSIAKSSDSALTCYAP